MHPGMGVPGSWCRCPATLIHLSLYRPLRGALGMLCRTAAAAPHALARGTEQLVQVS